MQNFPLTRTVLNLCLVVLLAIQPVAGAQRSCEDTRSACADSGGPSCQCCVNGAKREQRGCCRAALKTSDGCCGRAKLGRKHGAGAFVASPSSDLNPQAVNVSGCRCGLHSEPAIPAPIRVPASELRDLVVVATLTDRDLTGHLISPSPRFNLALGVGTAAAHFSQRTLCVWRL